MRASSVALTAVAVLQLLLGAVGAYEFEMAYQTKCLMEEMSKDVLVLADYAAFHKDDPSVPVTVTVRVDDPKGRVIFDKQHESAGQFGFTTDEDGEYKTCFMVKDYVTAQSTRIRLDWKTGVAARDWDAIAKRESLNAMAAELRKLEETVKDILQEMMYLRTREEEMRNVNEATNARVAWFTLGSLFVCITLAVWQLWYLKKFFQRKKLL